MAHNKKIHRLIGVGAAMAICLTISGNSALAFNATQEIRNAVESRMKKNNAPAPAPAAARPVHCSYEYGAVIIGSNLNRIVAGMNSVGRQGYRFIGVVNTEGKKSVNAIIMEKKNCR